MNFSTFLWTFGVGKSRLVQPSFLNGEARYLLYRYVPNKVNDRFHVFIGARRDRNNNPSWHYYEDPNPGGFSNLNVFPWGKGQPDDTATPRECQCNLAMARLSNWPGRGFHDARDDQKGAFICEVLP